jgi:uridine kinase
MNPNDVFEIIRKHIVRIQKAKTKPVRIAINGIEGSGKTTFAEQLTCYLVSKEHTAIHVSIDGFHYHREHRYRQGKDSARGYYEDSYDEMTFAEKVLIASQDEYPSYLPTTHDLESDQYVHIPTLSLAHDAVLITDGAYLFKPIYRAHWDLKIYLRTDFETAQERGIKRDAELLGGYQSASDKYKNRYHAASRIYNDENTPETQADIIVDNVDYNRPIVIKGKLS